MTDGVTWLVDKRARPAGDQAPAGDERLGAAPVSAEEFAAVYDRYAPMLYRYAVRRLGSGPAEDAVSETFLAAFRNWHRYDPGRAGVRPWLFGILTREISHWRREEASRYRALATMPPTGPVGDPAERVSETVSAAAARAALGTGLARLSPAERDVLLLVAWSDLSYPEVADVLGIPVGTVASRLHRARRALREHLPGYDQSST